MLNILIALCVYSIIFLIIFLAITLGRKYGTWQRVHTESHSIHIVKVAEGTVFALLGLIIAFTFSGAFDRFEKRKERIIEEVNAIETAYLRLSLLTPGPVTQALRATMLQYVDARIETYLHPFNFFDTLEPSAKTLVKQAELWRLAVASTQLTNHEASTLLVIPAINNLFEIANVRHLYTRIHPPFAIFALLMVLAASGAFLAGYSMARDNAYNSLYTICFVIVTSFTIYITIDLEFPRVGIIRVNSFDNVLIEERHRLN